MRRAILSTAAMLGLAATSTAAPVTFSGSGFSITDSGSGSATIVVTGWGPITGSVSVTLLGLTHSFVGDLVVTLTHVETGTSIELFDRVGRTGGTGFGDSANLAGNYSFFDGASGDLWATALSSTDTAFVIPAGSYAPTGANGVATAFSVFLGVPLSGTWRLTIADLAGGDVGSLTGWQLSADAETPEGGSGFLVLTGLLAAAALRTSQREKDRGDS